MPAQARGMFPEVPKDLGGPCVAGEGETLDHFAICMLSLQWWSGIHILIEMAGRPLRRHQLD